MHLKKGTIIAIEYFIRPVLNMSLKSLILPFFVLIFINACTIADDLFTEKKEEPINLQSTAETNVSAFIKSQLDSTEIYKPYGFTALKITKPLAFEQLEELEKDLRTTPNDSSLIRQIRAKKAFISEEKLERSANFDHVFTITSDTTSIGILELNYRLNDTLGVADWTPKIALNVPTSYSLIIDYFYREHTIFMAPSYAEGRNLSHSFYSYFKTQLETFTTVDSKSAFLKHTLNICLELKALGTFDQNKITQSLFKRYIKEERADLTEYIPLEFSELYETKNNSDSSLVGYYFFHKFSGNYSSQVDTNLVLVEFSPYYEVGKIFQLEGTMESYTNTD